jgi:hypothetical protein
MATLIGLQAIAFKCPSCGGDRFGYEGDVGHCRRVGVSTFDDCNFTWPRRYDWRVFVRVADGSGFRSAAELSAFLDPREFVHIGRAMHAAPRESFVEMLQRLLAELMERPPTLGVVASWTREQHRAALHWCSREIVAHDAGVVTGVREPRPAFIEDGAATA